MAQGPILIIYAHSNPRSFTHAVLDEVVAGLRDEGATPDVVDLYADRFDPVLLVDEHHRRRDLDKVPETQAYRDQLARAGAVIFVYPVWWGGFPAILKGYLDRVFVSGLTYSFANRPAGAVFPEGLMRGRAAYFFYTLDSPWLVALLDPGWFSNLFTVFRYCGFGPVKRFYLHRLKVTSDAQRRAWLTRVRAEARRIGRRHTALPNQPPSTSGASS